MRSYNNYFGRPVSDHSHNSSFGYDSNAHGYGIAATCHHHNSPTISYFTENVNANDEPNQRPQTVHLRTHNAIVLPSSADPTQLGCKSSKREKFHFLKKKEKQIGEQIRHLESLNFRKNVRIEYSKPLGVFNSPESSRIGPIDCKVYLKSTPTNDYNLSSKSNSHGILLQSSTEDQKNTSADEEKANKAFSKTPLANPHEISGLKNELETVKQSLQEANGALFQLKETLGHLERSHEQQLADFRADQDSNQRDNERKLEQVQKKLSEAEGEIENLSALLLSLKTDHQNHLLKKDSEFDKTLDSLHKHFEGNIIDLSETGTKLGPKLTSVISSAEKWKLSAVEEAKAQTGTALRNLEEAYGEKIEKIANLERESLAMAERFAREKTEVEKRSWEGVPVNIDLAEMRESILRMAEAEIGEEARKTMVDFAKKLIDLSKMALEFAKKGGEVRREGAVGDEMGRIFFEALRVLEEGVQAVINGADHK